MALQCELLINDRVKSSTAYVRVLQVLVNPQQAFIDVLLAVYNSFDERKDDVVDKTVKLTEQLETIKAKKLALGQARNEADKAYVDAINKTSEESPELWALFQKAQAAYDAAEAEQEAKQLEIEGVFGEQPLLTKMTYSMVGFDMHKPLLQAVYERLKSSKFSGVMDNKKIEMNFATAVDV